MDAHDHSKQDEKKVSVGTRATKPFHVQDDGWTRTLRSGQDRPQHDHDSRTSSTWRSVCRLRQSVSTRCTEALARSIVKNLQGSPAGWLKYVQSKATIAGNRHESHLRAQECQLSETSRFTKVGIGNEQRFFPGCQRALSASNCQSTPANGMREKTDS